MCASRGISRAQDWALLLPTREVRLRSGRDNRGSARARIYPLTLAPLRGGMLGQLRRPCLERRQHLVGARTRSLQLKLRAAANRQAREVPHPATIYPSSGRTDLLSIVPLDPFRRISSAVHQHQRKAARSRRRAVSSACHRDGTRADLAALGAGCVGIASSREALLAMTVLRRAAMIGAPAGISMGAIC